MKSGAESVQRDITRYGTTWQGALQMPALVPANTCVGERVRGKRPDDCVRMALAYTTDASIDAMLAVLERVGNGQFQTRRITESLHLMHRSWALMDNETSNTEVGERIRALRIIVGLMALGIAAFAAMAQVAPIKSDASLEKIMTIVTAAMGLCSLIAFVPIRMLIISGGRSKVAANGADSAKSVSIQTYFTTTLIGSAMAEGVALLGIVSSMVTGQKLLLLAAAIGVVAILLQFPTSNGFARCYQAVAGKQLPSSDWPE